MFTSLSTSIYASLDISFTYASLEGHVYFVKCNCIGWLELIIDALVGLSIASEY